VARGYKTISSGLDGIEAYHRHIRFKWLLLCALAVSTFLLMLICVNAGTAKINPMQVLKTILGGGGEKDRIVIWRIRMPRVVSALVAGAGLSVSGCVMQNTLKNPLASPSP
jgi:iron complex transport system permease protein